MTFGTFGQAKVREKKSYFMFLYGGSKPPPYAQNPNIANKQNKNYTSVFLQRTDFTHARHTFICGRADNACTNLLGFFV